MADEIKQVQFKTNQLPVFAEEILISMRLKASKTKNATGFVRLQFVDTYTSQVLADIVIDAVTCEGLVDVLKSKLEEINKVIKSSDPEKEIKRLLKQQPVKIGGTEEEPQYTG